MDTRTLTLEELNKLFQPIQEHYQLYKIVAAINKGKPEIDFKTLESFANTIGFFPGIDYKQNAKQLQADLKDSEMFKDSDILKKYNKDSVILGMLDDAITTFSHSSGDKGVLAKDCLGRDTTINKQSVSSLDELKSAVGGEENYKLLDEYYGQAYSMAMIKLIGAYFSAQNLIITNPEKVCNIEIKGDQIGLDIEHKKYICMNEEGTALEYKGALRCKFSLDKDKKQFVLTQITQTGIDLFEFLESFGAKREVKVSEHGLFSIQPDHFPVPGVQSLPASPSLSTPSVSPASVSSELTSPSSVPSKDNKSAGERSGWGSGLSPSIIDDYQGSPDSQVDKDKEKPKRKV